MSKTERTCLSCGATATKAELFRWVVANDAIMLDWQGRFPGRAVYTHPQKECVKKFYARRSFPTRFFTGKKSFVTPVEEIVSHIYHLAFDSYKHFSLLGIKSRAITIGQEAISDKQEHSNKQFGAVLMAHNISEKTLKKIPRNIQKSAITLPFGKEQFGAFLTGRPVGIVAVERGSLSDRLSFYANIMTRFFSGDVHADK